MEEATGWFIPALTLIFVVAKLVGLINWSWWLVFTPLIICVVVSLIVF